MLFTGKHRSEEIFQHLAENPKQREGGAGGREEEQEVGRSGKEGGGAEGREEWEVGRKRGREGVRWREGRSEGGRGREGRVRREEEGGKGSEDRM